MLAYASSPEIPGRITWPPNAERRDPDLDGRLNRVHFAIHALHESFRCWRAASPAQCQLVPPYFAKVAGVGEGNWLATGLSLITYG